jgi:peptidoglycan-associated lipoprotein
MMKKVELQDVFFAFDVYELSPEARDILAKDADILKDNPGTTITIEGHCDERGTREYNLGLGERRANSAKNYLVSLGISSSRIRTITYGEDRPFDEGHNERAWAKNRRAHFVVR